MNTKIVSFDLSLLDYLYSINLSEVVVVDSIPVAPSVVPSKDRLHRSTKFQKIFLSFMEIVISYRFLGAESENDNKNLRLALVFEIFSILVFYE